MRVKKVHPMYTPILSLGYLIICDIFHLPYRQTEGVTRAHSRKKVSIIPDYSRINRRVNQTKPT